MEITSSAVIDVCRVFAIAKTRNNDANEKSSGPGFDDLVIQSGKEDESNIEESKPDTESQFRGDSRSFKKITRRFFADRDQEATSGSFSSHPSDARALVAPLLVLSSNI